MTMIPLGSALTSAAGTALSQTAGSDTERAQKDTISQRRIIDADLHAEQSAGIGETEKDQESSERDADGRRLWERPGEYSKKNETDCSIADSEADVQSRQSKDPTGQSGTKLDLTG
jgi:hypothetical protein